MCNGFCQRGGEVLQQSGVPKLGAKEGAVVQRARPETLVEIWKIVISKRIDEKTNPEVQVKYQEINPNFVIITHASQMKFAEKRKALSQNVMGQTRDVFTLKSEDTAK